VRLPVPTVATSPTRTIPFVRLATTTASRSATERIAPAARTISASSPFASRPAPSLRFPLSIAALRSATLRPACASFVGSGRTSKVRTVPPSALTSATPGTVRSAGRMVQSSSVRFSSRLSGPSIVNM